MLCQELLVKPKHPERSRICKRNNFECEKRCFFHIRKWLHNRLKELGIIIDYPNSHEKIHKALNHLRHADPTYEDCLGRNIIHLGVMDNNLNLVKKGIEFGIDVNSPTLLDANTPIHFARNISKNILITCLKAGANINAKNIFGDTPLITHCKFSINISTETIRLFLQWGADETIRNTSGCAAARLIGYVPSFYNLLTINKLWNTSECMQWRQSILFRFIGRLPNINNRGALFDAIYEYLDLPLTLSIQYT